MWVLKVQFPLSWPELGAGGRAAGSGLSNISQGETRDRTCLSPGQAPSTAHFSCTVSVERKPARDQTFEEG